MGRIRSGFTTVREVLSYAIGTCVLVYGVAYAPADRALIVVGAGLALLGSPIVGDVFEKRTKE